MVDELWLGDGCMTVAAIAKEEPAGHPTPPLREGEAARGGEDELAVLLETLKSTTVRISELTAKRG